MTLTCSLLQNTRDQEELHDALLSCDLPTIRRVLLRHKQHVVLRNALSVAVRSGCVSSVKTLMRYALWARPAFDDYASLLLAAQMHNIPIFAELLKNINAAEREEYHVQQRIQQAMRIMKKRKNVSSAM